MDTYTITNIPETILIERTMCSPLKMNFSYDAPIDMWARRVTLFKSTVAATVQTPYQNWSMGTVRCGTFQGFFHCFRPRCRLGRRIQ
ncbi:hypothetical protein Y032_0297g1742 [Ancylostoma ceylanicum]|nr:hypothetical protein Y032_0297g1742 [Ancylostoma ceylanicum]